MRLGTLKTKEKLRINNLKILHFRSYAGRQNKSNRGCFLVSFGDHRSSIRSGHPQQAHIASDEYYTMAHAAAWNTTFEFPPEAIAADRMLWDQCGHDKLASNRLPADRVIDIFGEDGTMIPGMLLSDFRLHPHHKPSQLEFATHSITPIVAEDFVPERINIPPLQARYITLKHTINSFLFEQLGKGTMIIMETEQPKTTLVHSTTRTPKANLKAALYETCLGSMTHLSLPSMELLKAKMLYEHSLLLLGVKYATLPLSNWC